MEKIADPVAFGGNLVVCSTGVGHNVIPLLVNLCFAANEETFVNSQNLLARSVVYLLPNHGPHCWVIFPIFPDLSSLWQWLEWDFMIQFA